MPDEKTMTKTKKILFLALALMLYAAPGCFAATRLNTPRSGNTVTVLPNGNILITGGHTGNGVPTNTAEIYISSKATYENLPNMNVKHSSHTATLLPDGRVFIFGGYSAANSATNSYTIFDPKNNSFVKNGTIGTLRAGHSASLITNGEYKNMVMLCGGCVGDGGGVKTCDIVEFDNSGNPSLNTTINMMNSVSMADAGKRRDFTATMLSSGNIFISGGRKSGDGGTYVQANVTFDTENNTFGTESALTIGRRSHAAITMNDGRVAIIGGFNEMYTPPYDVNTDDDWYNKDGADVAERQSPGYHGFIDTVELFDKFGKPTIISGAESGVKTLPYRVANASGILSPGGRLYLYGGRGNIPVTFADIEVEFVKNGSSDSVLQTTGGVTSVGDARKKSIDQSASHLYFELDKTTLSRPVSGRIIDGDIFVPTSDKDNIAIKSGSEENGGIAVTFVGHPQQNSSWDKEDIRAPLDGLKVGRQADSDYKSGEIGRAHV